MGTLERTRGVWDKFSEGQLPWSRDMTSYVAGGLVIFEGKCMFFQLFSTIKVNLVNKMTQSDYLYDGIHVMHKKNTIYRNFNLISQFLVKLKMETIVGDVTGL